MRRCVNSLQGVGLNAGRLAGVAGWSVRMQGDNNLERNLHNAQMKESVVFSCRAKAKAFVTALYVH